MNSKVHKQVLAQSPELMALALTALKNPLVHAEIHTNFNSLLNANFEWKRIRVLFDAIGDLMSSTPFSFHL